MKIHPRLFGAALLIVLFSCGGEDLVLNKNKNQSFSGSYKLLNSKLLRKVEASGTSTLEISNGRFISTTYVEDRGYGHAAGTLKITENKIIFTDTVSKIFLWHVLPPKYLNGTYDYKFDGDKLEIGNKLGSDWIDLYTFNLKK